MRKFFSKEPIFFKDLNELKKISNTIHREQSIQYVCVICGRLAHRRLFVLRKHDYEPLCMICTYERTNLEKRGVKNPQQTKETQEKMKQTNLKKRGVEYTFQSPIVKEKSKQTWLKCYGYRNPSQVPEIKEKKIHTWMAKYGVPNPNYIPDHNEKFVKTCLEKYGVTNPTYLPDHQEKSKQTSLKKYGTDHPQQSREVRIKSRRKYEYNGLGFDSSWELAVWIWAHDMGKHIVREPVSFTYTFNNKTYHYFPDFDIDGQLVEIKGGQFVKKDGTFKHPYNINETKKYEAKHQCGLQHNVVFWLKSDIEPILQYITITYGSNYLKSFRN